METIVVNGKKTPVYNLHYKRPAEYSVLFKDYALTFQLPASFPLKVLKLEHIESMEFEEGKKYDDIGIPSPVIKSYKIFFKWPKTEAHAAGIYRMFGDGPGTYGVTGNDTAKYCMSETGSGANAVEGGDLDVRNLTLEESEIVRKAIADATSNAKPVSRGLSAKRSETADSTPELEAEIIRILNRAFTKLKAHPTASEFYQEYVINGRTMAGLTRAKGWKARTLKSRKASIEKHLSQELKTIIDLDELRTAQRRSGRLVYADPHVIERTQATPQ